MGGGYAQLQGENAPREAISADRRSPASTWPGPPRGWAERWFSRRLEASARTAAAAACGRGGGERRGWGETLAAVARSTTEFLATERTVSAAASAGEVFLGGAASDLQAGRRAGGQAQLTCLVAVALLLPL